MKKLILTLSVLSLFSCENSEKLEFVNQEIVDGKVSAIMEGRSSARFSSNPKIWVQNATNTQEVEIPFEYENRWKVGDSCLLIIKRYKEVGDGE